MEYWLGFFIVCWIVSEYIRKTSSFKPKDSTKSFSFSTDRTESKVVKTKRKSSYPIDDLGATKYNLMFISRQKKQEYMRTIKWKNLKIQRMKIAQHKCECCGSTDNLHLHHVTYIRLTQEHIEDLLILCGGPNGCHQKIHNKLGYDRTTEYPLSEIK